MVKGVLTSGPALGAGEHAGHFGVGDQLEEGLEVEELEDEADRGVAEGRELGIAHPADVRPVDDDAAGRGLVQAADQLKEVDLPEPLAPTRATNSPSSMVRLTPSRAWIFCRPTV